VSGRAPRNALSSKHLGKPGPTRQRHDLGAQQSAQDRLPGASVASSPRSVVRASAAQIGRALSLLATTVVTMRESEQLVPERRVRAGALDHDQLSVFGEVVGI
jgi:hypothetical protein